MVRKCPFCRDSPALSPALETTNKGVGGIEFLRDGVGRRAMHDVKIKGPRKFDDDCRYSLVRATVPETLDSRHLCGVNRNAVIL